MSVRAVVGEAAGGDVGQDGAVAVLVGGVAECGNLRSCVWVVGDVILCGCVGSGIGYRSKCPITGIRNMSVGLVKQIEQLFFCFAVHLLRVTVSLRIE